MILVFGFLLALLLAAPAQAHMPGASFLAMHIAGASGNSPLAQFLDYLSEGVRHIWIGADHILFILSLLLPAVLVVRNLEWTAAARFRDSFWDVFKVVTSFTIAHSITLSLALVGFNLGVEVGQLAIVGAFLPLALALRGSWFYRRLVFSGGSAAIALVAAVWLAERAFDVKLWP